MCLRIATKWRTASKPLSSRCFSFARLTPSGLPLGCLFMRDRLVGAQLGNSFSYLTGLPFCGFDVVCNGFGGEEGFGAVDALGKRFQASLGAGVNAELKQFCYRV